MTVGSIILPSVLQQQSAISWTRTRVPRTWAPGIVPGEKLTHPTEGRIIDPTVILMGFGRVLVGSNRVLV